MLHVIMSQGSYGENVSLYNCIQDEFNKLGPDYTIDNIVEKIRGGSSPIETAIRGIMDLKPLRKAVIDSMIGALVEFAGKPFPLDRYEIEQQLFSVTPFDPHKLADVYSSFLVKAYNKNVRGASQRPTQIENKHIEFTPELLGKIDNSGLTTSITTLYRSARAIRDRDPENVKKTAKATVAQYLPRMRAPIEMETDAGVKRILVPDEAVVDRVADALAQVVTSINRDKEKKKIAEKLLARAKKPDGGLDLGKLPEAYSSLVVDYVMGW